MASPPPHIPVVSRDLATWLMNSHIVKPASLRPASPSVLPPQLQQSGAASNGQWLQIDANGVSSLLQGAGFVDLLSSYVKPPGYKSGSVYSNTPHARATNWSLVQRLLADDMGLSQLATEDEREAWLCGEVEAVLMLADRLRMAIPAVQANIRRAAGTKSHPAGPHHQPRGAQQRTPEPRKAPRLAPISNPPLAPPPVTDPGMVAQQVTQLATLLLHQQQLHLALQQQQRALHAHEQAQFYQMAFHQQPHMLPPLAHPAVAPPLVPAGGYPVVPQPFMPMQQQHHQQQEPYPHQEQPYNALHNARPEAYQHDRQPARASTLEAPLPGSWTPVSLCRLESAELQREGLDPVPMSRGSLSSSASNSPQHELPRMAPKLTQGPDDSDEDEGGLGSVNRTTSQQPMVGQRDGRPPQPKRSASHRTRTTPQQRQPTPQPALTASVVRREETPVRKRLDMDSRESNGEGSVVPWMASLPASVATASWSRETMDTLRRHVIGWWRDAHRVVEKTAFLLWLRWTLPRALKRRQEQSEAALADAPPSVLKAKGNRRMNARTAHIVEDLAMHRKRQRRHLILAGQHILRMANVKLGLITLRKWVSWHLLVREERPLVVPQCAVVTPRGTVAVDQQHDSTAPELESHDTHAFDAIVEARDDATPLSRPRQCPVCASVTDDAASKWCHVCGEPLERVAPLPNDVRREDHWRLTLEYGRLDMVSRFDRRAPAVSLATNLLQKVMRGLIDERYVKHTVASRVFAQRAPRRSQLAVPLFAAVFVGKLLIRKKAALEGGQRPSDLLPMHAEMAIAILRRDLQSRALPSRTIMLLPSAVATARSTPHSKYGCCCGRCFLALTMFTRQLFARQYDIQSLDVEALSPMGRHADAHSSPPLLWIVRSSRIYATALCPLGRRRRAMQLTMERHTRSSLTTLRSVALVCVAIVRLLQRPWPVGWYDARLRRSQLVFDETATRARIEDEWWITLAQVLQSEFDDVDDAETAASTPASPSSPNVNPPGATRVESNRHCLNWSDPLIVETWWYHAEDPVADLTRVCPPPPPPSEVDTSTPLASCPPSRAASLASEAKPSVRGAVGTPLTNGFHDPPPSSAATSSVGSRRGLQSRPPSVASTTSAVAVRKTPLNSTPIEHNFTPPATPASLPEPSAA